MHMKKKHGTYSKFLLVIAGEFLMVIGGETGSISQDERGINEIEVVSFDPADATVPECLQNLSPFPATAIKGYVVRF